MEKLGGSCSFSLVWMGKIHRSWAFSVSGKEPLSLQDQQHFRLQGVTLEALAEASLMEGGFPKIQHFRGQTVPASCGLDSLDGEEATERAKHPPGCEGDGRLKSWSCQGFAGGGGWGRPAAIWEQIQAGWLGNTWERWKCWAVYPRGEQRPQEGTKQSDLSGTGVFNKETVKKKTNSRAAPACQGLWESHLAQEHSTAELLRARTWRRKRRKRDCSLHLIWGGEEKNPSD